MNILLLHPGAMGASVGAALVGNGHAVTWVRDSRSAATHKRADRAGLRTVDTLEVGVQGAELVMSICPPEAAFELAQAVRETGFTGIYLDGNAIAPGNAAKIEQLFGKRYVDGGIIGPPAWRQGATRFYLSGGAAPQVATLFAGSLLDARVVAGSSVAASALKMCYAAFTKGSSALLLGVRALAERNGVSADLLAEWDISQPGLAGRSSTTAQSTSPKAWRFAGEMQEIAATFAAAELPDGFHRAAADLYARMAELKNVPGGADINAVLQTLLGGSAAGHDEEDIYDRTD